MSSRCRSGPVGRLATAVVVLTAATLIAVRPASASPLSACTQSYAGWTQARDAVLVRLEPTPTLLGLDNTWCTRSPSHVSDLRNRLAAIRTICSSVEEKDQAQVADLIARTERLLSQTRICAPPPATVTQRDAWSTSVRPTPSSSDKKPVSKALVPTSGSAPPEPGKSGLVAASAKASPKGVAENTKIPTADPKPLPPSAATVSKRSQPGSTALPPAIPQGGPALQRFAVAAGPNEAGPIASEPGQSAPGRAQAPPPAAPSPPLAVSDPECLSVLTSSSTTFIVENKHCPTQIVLTAIELAGDDQPSRCFTKKIRSQISLASSASAPHINYQCIEGSPGCSVEVLRGMFPECYAG